MGASLEQNALRSLEPVFPDRRRYERLRTRAAIRITKVGDAHTSFAGECTDVSIGGVGFNSAAVLPVGETIEYEFANADHAALRFHARILYRRGDHYGAYYLDAR
jgi:hypothetical protein